MDHSRVRYLEAKRTVDERALNRRVRDALLDALPDRPRVFEAGCGTGATVPRLLAWGVEPAAYVGVDRDAEVVAFARDARPAELRRLGHDAVDTERGFRLGDVTVEFRVGDALEAAVGASSRGDAAGGRRGRDDGDAGTADLVVAQAFADLVALDDLLAAVERALAPGGLAYLPITFDGGTVFQPDHSADDAVVAAYHEHIDAADGRDSRAGRHLATRLQERDGELLAMGASDWVVRPAVGGGDARSGGESTLDDGSALDDGSPVESGSATDSHYPADEAHFLGTILDFVESTLAETDAEIAEADDWLATRRQQLREGDLLYVAHQYDLLYRAPE